MNTKILSKVVVLLLVTLSSVQAADLAGNWILRTPCRHTVCKTVFSFKVDGEKLTGKISTQEGDYVISEGLIDGGTFSFVVKQSIDDKQITFHYTGKFAGMVYGDEIALKRKVLGGTGETQEFIAKREFPLGDYDQWPVLDKNSPPVIIK